MSFNKAFLFGILTGMSLALILSYIFPDNIRAVNENNVANGRGYYHPTTGEFTWKDCK